MLVLDSIGAEWRRRFAARDRLVRLPQRLVKHEQRRDRIDEQSNAERSEIRFGYLHCLEPARAVEDQRQPADGAGVHADAHHLGKREVALGHALDVAHCTTAEIDGRKSGGLGKLAVNGLKTTGASTSTFPMIIVR